jgi:ATP-dependent DNA helicase RecG
MLNRLNLIKSGKVKNAAVALFRGFPLLEVQMAIFATAERLTFNDINRSGGNIMQLAAIAEKYIRNNIRWRVVFDGSLQRKEIPEIPMDAVREAIINSFCHRDYKSSQNNEIVIYSNRVEIYNPGAFPVGLTPKDFIDGTGYSVKRNPLLAQLMYYTKDIESFGTGLKRISDACRIANVKVEFQEHKMGFAVMFYRADALTEAAVGESIKVNYTSQDTCQCTSHEQRTASILAFCVLPRTRKEMQEYLGIANRAYFSRVFLKPLLDSGKLKMTIPEKPNSSSQKYVNANIQ